MLINPSRVITLTRLNTLSSRLGRRIFLILFLLSGCLSLALLSSASHNSSGNFFVFGPANYVRERGAPSPVSSNFSAQPGPNYLLRVYNGGRDNQYRSTSRAAIGSMASRSFGLGTLTRDATIVTITTTATTSVMTMTRLTTFA